MYIDYYREDPDYFCQSIPRQTDNSYYYDGRNIYQGGYGRTVSGQDPCYYTNMRQQQYRQNQNPFNGYTETRRYDTYPEQQQYGMPQTATYGDPNYFGSPMGYGQEPQYFGYRASYPEVNRTYDNFRYTPQTYQAYESPKPQPQPQQGLNTSLFAQQSGYSNPINQNIPQSVPQRQLLKVSCPQQVHGFGPNRYNTPRMPEDPHIDWSSLSNLNSNPAPGYGNPYGTYGQERLIPRRDQFVDTSWYETAKRNFNR